MDTITVFPEATFEATLDGATDLAGALTVGIYDSPDEVTAFYGPSSTGVVENPVGSGLYAVELTAPGDPGTYSIVWTDGELFARDVLDVVAEGAGVAVKIDRTQYHIGPGRQVAVARNQPLYVLQKNGPLDRAVNLGTETLVEGFSDEAMTVSLGTGPFISNSDGQYDVFVPAAHYDLYSPNDRTRPVTRWQPIAGGVPAAVAALSAQVADLGTEVGAFDGRLDDVEADSPLGSVTYAKPYLDSVIYANKTVALEAAMMATPAYGGTVILPAEIILMVGELTYPAMKKIVLKGAGTNSTYLVWTVDTGAGTWAVLGTDQVRHELRDLTLTGPVSAVIDGASANMGGFKHMSRNIGEDLVVQNFKHGIGTCGDHNRLRRISFTGCQDNIRYLGPTATTLGTEGNCSMDEIECVGAARAGISFAPDANVFGATWSNMHLGMGPLGLCWDVDGSNNAAAVSGIVLDSPVFENVGNAMFYSGSVDPLGAGIFIATIINGTRSQFPGATSAAPAGMRSAGLRDNIAHADGLAAVNVMSIDSDAFGFEAGPVPDALQSRGYCIWQFQGQHANIALDQLVSTGAEAYITPNNFTLNTVTWREGYKTAEMHYCDAVGITSGRLVYRSAEGGVKPWVSGKEVYGVALQTGAAYDFIPIGRKGTWPVANSATGALAVGDGVIPDTTTADGKAKIAGSAPGAIIGTALSVAAASTTVQVDLQPSGWRF
jgi:hypothetical protein